MKTALITLTIALSFIASSHAGLAPSNPPPVVRLAWDADSDATTTNYFIYYGVASGNYTNKVAVGNVLTTSITMPARGVTYFYAATAQSSGEGLESSFSSEVSWTPLLPPPAPNLKTPVTLSVVKKPHINAQWADAGMNWSLSPDDTNQIFGLRLAWSPPQATPQMKAAIALREKMLMPTTVNAK